MAVPELAYLLVAAEPIGSGTGEPSTAAGRQGQVAAAAAPPPQGTARYTRSLLRQTLQLMGFKPRQSDKAAQKAFYILQQRAALPLSEPLSVANRLHAAPGGHSGITLSRAEFDRLIMDCLAAFDQEPQPAPTQPQAPLPPQQVEPSEQGRQPRSVFAMQQGLQAGEPGQAAAPAAAAIPTSLQDFQIACALREQRSSVAVLLCGTSGTGKSTLAALLAARLGISTVVSTDSIRHMMRSFTSEEEDPLLWASTYEAGAYVQQQQPAPAAAAGNGGGGSSHQREGSGGSCVSSGTCTTGGRGGTEGSLAASNGVPAGGSGVDLSVRKAAIRGYKAQASRVLDHVDRLLSGCEARRQSVVVEGVHLSLSMVVRLMQRHRSVIPFLVHISNESKHMERFAVRSKVMTLRPDGNRYVKHFRNIRAIQDYLVKSADKHAIPKVDNTNVDRSVATIHTTVLGCLRRTARGESVLSVASLSCKLLLEEYLRCQSTTWSSSDMLELIRRKSAAGEVPSPSEADSTTTINASAAAAAAAAGGPPADAAPATLHATSPKGPLPDVAADEVLRTGSGSVHAGCSGTGDHEGAGDEEDNHSFYGSDNQSSSGGEGASSSCLSSGEEEEEEEEEAGDNSCREEGEEREGLGPLASQQPAFSSKGRQVPDGMVTVAAGGGNLLLQRTSSGSLAGWSGVIVHRQRRRRRWQGQRGSGRTGLHGEIPAGPVPESMRRRSEVGSVLEPEPQSDTEDAEVGMGGVGSCEAADDAVTSVLAPAVQV